jgi:hypothetical protein
MVASSGTRFGEQPWNSIRNMRVASWKHAAVSYVEQHGVPPQPKDRGAEQGDVDGPMECSLTLGAVARDTRSAIHRQQRQGQLPWACETSADVVTSQDDFDRRVEMSRTYQEQRANAVDHTDDPRLEVQRGGGIADFWYLDGGDVLCCPELVEPFFAAFDQANPRVGAERSCPKTEVIYYCTP